MSDRRFWRSERDAQARGLRQLEQLRDVAAEKRRRAGIDPGLAEELAFDLVDRMEVEPVGDVQTVVVSYYTEEVGYYATLIGAYRKALALAGRNLRLSQVRVLAVWHQSPRVRVRAGCLRRRRRSRSCRVVPARPDDSDLDPPPGAAW